MGQKCCPSANGGSLICTQAQPIPNEPQVTAITDPVMTNLQEKPPMVYMVSVAVLVQKDGHNIMFDTAGIAQRPIILRNLMTRAGLTAEDIDMLVLSHGHPDHFGNMDLFPDALMSYNGNIHNQSVYNFPFTQPIYLFNDRSLELIRTPGETSDGVSFVVRNVPGRGTVVLTADVINEEKDKGPDQDFPWPTGPKEPWRESRKKVACIADWILPGHGQIFQATPQWKRAFNC